MDTNNTTLIIEATESSNDTLVQTIIPNINPNATDNNLALLATKINALSYNSFVDSIRQDFTSKSLM